MSAIAGISGGRSSAMMALLYAPLGTVLTFQNTGREHPKTIEFLRRLEEDLGRDIIPIEYRAPARGRPPRESTFEVVDWSRLAMRGEPFLDMLECTRTFRAQKDPPAPPIAPWAKSRICTAYLKIKTMWRFAASIGLGGERECDVLVGLRHDEPLRIARMKLRNDKRDTHERAPLDENGVTKTDVLRFWAAKPYDLEIPEHLGNCTGCFMKDERDLASALIDPVTDAQWWIDIEAKYGPMRRNRTSYADVLAEAPERMNIRAQLAARAEVVSSLPPRRKQLIIRQEESEREAWSCSCDAAEEMPEDDMFSLEAE